MKTIEFYDKLRLVPLSKFSKKKRLKPLPVIDFFSCSHMAKGHKNKAYQR